MCTRGIRLFKRDLHSWLSPLEVPGRNQPSGARVSGTNGASAPHSRERAAMLSTVLLIVLVLLLVGAIPSWPYSRSWGYGPSGLLGVVLVVVLILALTGRV